MNADRHLLRPATRLIPVLGGCALAAALLGFGQAPPDPWLILTNGKTGPINAHTTFQDLVRQYETKNVVEREIDVGEGETRPGVVVFPDDPLRSIEILWKNPKEKSSPKLVKIHGSASRWKTVHGISLGTSLKELEGLNGRPFHLAGFDWDYSGTVYSWDGGLLEKDLRSEKDLGGITLRLGRSSEAALMDQELRQVSGDQSISSRHAMMQKINPRVYEVVWVFPDDRPRKLTQPPSR